MTAPHQIPAEASPSNRVTIFDTTLRDGDQSPGFALNLREKREMACALGQMGVDAIEAGFPASSPLDFQAVKAIAEKVKGPRIAALARAVEGDIVAAGEALENCERPRIHTFIATSAEHMAVKLRKTPEQVLQSIDSSVRLARQVVGVRGDVEWSAEAASRSDIGFLIQAVKAAVQAGATTINLPDTEGYAMPGQYEALFRTVIGAVNAPKNVVFSAHTHNDLGMAVANALAAIHGGARQVECTIKGIGERAGNAQMEAIVAAMQIRNDIHPFWCGIHSSALKSVADLHSSFFENEPHVLPIVGDNAFAHGSGIHQSGVMRGGSCYEIADPCQFGHKASAFPLTRHSGEAGVRAALEQQGLPWPEEHGTDFMRRFKEAASVMLERDKVRVIPPFRVGSWVKRWYPQPACKMIA